MFHSFLQGAAHSMQDLISQIRDQTCVPLRRKFGVLIQGSPLNIPFLKQTMTGKEKWILYNNVEWKGSWGKRKEPPPTIPNASLHPKKVMLCMWWNWKEVLYCELLLEKQIISSKNYSQLD